MTLRIPRCSSCNTRLPDLEPYDDAAPPAPIVRCTPCENGENQAGCCPGCGSADGLDFSETVWYRASWSEEDPDFAWIGESIDSEARGMPTCATCGYICADYDWR